MNIQELKTLHHICESERIQLLSILATSEQNSRIDGYMLTPNRSTFLYLEVSTAWLYDCCAFPSPLFEVDKSFDGLPKNHQDTVMYIDPIARKTFDYATPKSCNNRPQNVIAIDTDNEKQFVLTPKHELRATSVLFEPKQFKSAICTKTFTAQETGVYSNAELTNFWNRVSFTKHTDNKLKLWGKSISLDSFNTSEKYPTDFFEPLVRNRFNPYNVLRVDLHDHSLKIASLFAPDWFADSFITIFGFLCYILTQCSLYSSTFLFLQYFIAIVMKFQ